MLYLSQMLKQLSSTINVEITTGKRKIVELLSSREILNILQQLQSKILAATNLDEKLRYE